MRRPRALVPALAPAIVAAWLAAGCGGGAPLPESDLSFRVVADAEEVRSGEAFPLTVVRAWRKDLVPAAWDDGALAPLVLRPAGVSVREDAVRVEETRRYRAYAFAPGDLALRPPPFAARPRDGGPDLRAPAGGLRLRVRAAVDPGDPGPPELPDGPRPEPFPWGTALSLAGGALALAAALAARLARRRRARREAPPAAPPPPVPDVGARALAALRELRARGPADPEARAADVAAAARILRAYVGERFGVPVRERTSEEILADGRVTSAAERGDLDLLARVMRAGRLVKFADDRPTPEDRDAVLGAAETFVGRTAPPPAGRGAP